MSVKYYLDATPNQTFMSLMDTKETFVLPSCHEFIDLFCLVCFGCRNVWLPILMAIRLAEQIVMMVILFRIGVVFEQRN